ncbi:hypothetical protein Sta7437_0864 [Stanieria cyanosphaera PCC 7437]|uniref:Uncharacterized protein n=2 Tax=Stanieria cyanosphaera TaxID=102116 RepID=K9XQW3_STAC7|nr:hypothetical protein Sta7437_0864 [Stanieria cyanosphaera PCC 7437]
MTNVNQDLAIAQTVALITRYGFDLGTFTVEELMEKWLKSFHSNWIRLATIEALYLGRYKAVSIEQILAVWLRLGNPNTHFTHEFERLISRKLPRHLADLSDEFVETTPIDQKAPVSKTHLNLLLTSQELLSSNENKVLQQNSSELPEEEITNIEAKNQQSNYFSPSPTNQETGAEVNFQDLYASPDTESEEFDDSTGSQSNFSPASALGLPHQPNNSRSKPEQKLIHKFTPLPDFSTFYHKLKTLAQRKLEEE